MDERKDSEINPTKYGTTVERKSERELVVTRTFNSPAHRLRCVDQTRIAQAVVGTEVVWSVLPFLRGRCSYGGHVPFRVQSRFLGAAYVILW
jgi:hypothetical protein